MRGKPHSSRSLVIIIITIMTFISIAVVLVMLNSDINETRIVASNSRGVLFLHFMCTLLVSRLAEKRIYQ